VGFAVPEAAAVAHGRNVGIDDATGVAISYLKSQISDLEMR
jgi:hypothetical protein